MTAAAIVAVAFCGLWLGLHYVDYLAAAERNRHDEEMARIRRLGPEQPPPRYDSIGS